MLAPSTGDTGSADGSDDRLAACADCRPRRAGRRRRAVALSVLVAALLLPATERHATTALATTPLGRTPLATSAATPAPSAAPAGLGTTDETTSSPDVASPERALGLRALDAVGWDVDALGYNIEFLGPKIGLRALTFPYEKRIEVYVREVDTVEDLAHVLAHEIGHALDVEHNTADDRRAWLASRGLDPEHPWWPRSGDRDFATGAGDFAECFATWRTGDASFSELPGPCDMDLLQKLATRSS